MTRYDGRSQRGGVGAPKERRVGVCIVRVETQEEYLPITVTANRHLAHSLAFAEPDQVSTYMGPANALAAVQEFLDSFP
jgi:hypothetical protein